LLQLFPAAGFAPIQGPRDLASFLKTRNCSGCWRDTASDPRSGLYTIDIQPNQNFDLQAIARLQRRHQLAGVPVARNLF
jgi:hypothetical protein